MVFVNLVGLFFCIVLCLFLVHSLALIRGLVCRCIVTFGIEFSRGCSF